MEMEGADRGQLDVAGERELAGFRLAAAHRRQRTIELRSTARRRLRTGRPHERQQEHSAHGEQVDVQEDEAKTGAREERDADGAGDGEADLHRTADNPIPHAATASSRRSSSRSEPSPPITSSLFPSSIACALDFAYSTNWSN